MKVNSVSSFNYNPNKISFKHTAVPYPEYQYAQNTQKDRGFSVENTLDSFASKLSALFSPEVDAKAAEIKSGIDSIYDNQQNEKTSKKEQNPKKGLLSVLA